MRKYKKKKIGNEGMMIKFGITSSLTKNEYKNKETMQIEIAIFSLFLNTSKVRTEIKIPKISVSKFLSIM
ncbi:MAG TPA: hypothetical protein VFV86_04935 [Nitrososphaeraceae archaeon]|nr:hypothetical protein [Nitrososphaeraceae archaeon]